MNARDYILNKQIQWALNRGIELVGSEIDRGLKIYTRKLEENLFEPLSPSVRTDILAGDGSELSGSTEKMPKMHALHSSSALGVNIFQYWDSIKASSSIAHYCGFCRNSTTISRNISFEVKYPIDDGFRFSPNMDVVIRNVPEAKYKVFAVECKFSEAYSGHGHGGLKEKYLALDIWKDIPGLHQLADEISPDDKRFRYLHAAQLIKHVLGLSRAFGKKGFRLLYLWYDTLGKEGGKHREEIEEFLEIAKMDNLKIHAISYQELIIKIAYDARSSHREYVEYLTNRYL